MNPPILVFGMPRSGTTWIGKLFDSHPDTLYRHEPDSMRHLNVPLFPEKEEAPRYREELEQFIASLPRMRSPEVVGKQPLFPKNYQSAAGLAAYRASVMAAKATSRLRRHFPCACRPTASGYKHARLVWKSVVSSGRLGMCIDALPRTRAIHLIRHPCGVVASRLRGAAAHGFGRPTWGAGGLWLLKPLLATVSGKAHGLDLGTLQSLMSEEQLTWIWVMIQEKILADTADNNRALTVRYEDVCAEPIEMTRRMFDFAELEWQSQTEAFIHASTRGANSGYYSVFKNPQASAERWRQELAPPVIERIQRILRGSMLHRFYNDEPMAAAMPEAVS